MYQQPQTSTAPAKTPAPVKPGAKSTEFWLSVFVAVGAYVVAYFDGAEWTKPLALVVSALTAAGYSLSRGKAKAGG